MKLGELITVLNKARGVVGDEAIVYLDWGENGVEPLTAWCIEDESVTLK